MPWAIGRRESCPAGRPWAVYRQADSAGPERIVYCHPTRERAVAQLRALYANVGDASQDWSRLMRDQITAPIEWKAAGGSGELEGYASVFGNVDLGGDVVLPGAFRRTLDHWRKSRQPLPLIADHDLSTAGVIGSVREAKEDGTGLWVRAGFSSDTRAQSVRTKMIEGHLSGMSFTYEAVKHYMGQLAGKNVRFLQELRLFEATVTPFPMNELALASAKAVSNTPWSQFSQADYSDEQWARACLIDTGQGTGKQRYSLPVREPSGTVNRNGCHAAAARISQVQAAADVKRAAARALAGLYRGQLGEDPPASLLAMAGMAAASAELRAALHQALDLPSVAARKAAADILLDEYLTEPEMAPEPADEPAPDADGPADPPDEGTPGTPDDGLTPREYADMIANRGMADGSPASLDALEAEITRALEGQS